MDFLLLVVLLGLAGASPLPEEKVCRPHSRPWNVYINGEPWSCNGALIDEWWIVTSYECAPKPYSSYALLGKHELGLEESTEQRIQISDAIQHSPYRSPHHSLAMVRLAEPARFNPHVRPISLPTQCPLPGETCIVSGWGSTIPDQSKYNRELKCITVPIVDDQTCMDLFTEDIYWDPSMVCAGQNNTDNCLSGRASVMECNGQLQGVQWFSFGCSDPTDPSVYTKLCLYKNWIREVMDNYVPTATTEYPPWTT
ncbi:trypsinogen-like protein 3 [Halichoeres trimaculatus]|uniref:trypsinogen-like protein 3 n=1 Tax=Halichoeres trimaculatus TaxID=147232 RepID=UPI003D9E7B49